MKVIKAGDQLLITYRQNLCDDDIAVIREGFDQHLPGVEVGILDGIADVAVVRKPKRVAAPAAAALGWAFIVAGAAWYWKEKRRGAVREGS
jgi:hypothetical protein